MLFISADRGPNSSYTLVTYVQGLISATTAKGAQPDHVERGGLDLRQIDLVRSQGMIVYNLRSLDLFGESRTHRVCWARCPHRRIKHQQAWGRGHSITWSPKPMMVRWKSPARYAFPSLSTANWASSA